MPPRGPKPVPASQKKRRGTLQPSRNVHDVMEITGGVEGLVERPDGLPAAAVLVWDDYAPAAMNTGTLTQQDALAFGQWCVMSAHLQAAWADGDSGSPVPASYIQQWRTLGELFGLAGIKSRLIERGAAGGASRDGGGASGNLFVRNGTRR